MKYEDLYINDRLNIFILKLIPNIKSKDVNFSLNVLDRNTFNSNAIKVFTKIDKKKRLLKFYNKHINVQFNYPKNTTHVLYHDYISSEYDKFYCPLLLSVNDVGISVYKPNLETKKFEWVKLNDGAYTLCKDYFKSLQDIVDEMNNPFVYQPYYFGIFVEELAFYNDKDTTKFDSNVIDTMKYIKYIYQ